MTENIWADIRATTLGCRGHPLELLKIEKQLTIEKMVKKTV